MTKREHIFAGIAAVGVALGGATLYQPEPEHMPATIRILKAQEGFKGEPYPDAGGQSVGYGTHLPLTAAEGELLLAHRLVEVEHALAARWAPYADQPEHIKQALSLMGYQLGVSGELMFKKMFACLERDDTRCAAREVMDSRWNEQTPKRVAMVAALLESR